ncbi:MAG TPA: hypothetical protein VKR24_08320 [Candidatus Limnocylindrales bacterium]|nr:hypothetical protein [Candidatus Limnocylindrales bacterium]
MPARLPPPGASFLREQPIQLGDHLARAGMSRPAILDDGWWLVLLWVVDDEGVVSFRDAAPRAGPPPDPPVVRLGPALSGALSGLILEEDGRLCVRLAPLAPADDRTPWQSPIAIRAGFKWEPARALGMAPNELAQAVLAAFRQSVEGLGRS